MADRYAMVDFDDTMVNTTSTAFRRMNARLGTNLSIYEVKDYDLTKYLGKELFKEFEHEVYSEDFYRDTHFYKNALKGMKILRDLDYKLIGWTKSKYDFVDGFKKKKLEELPKGLIYGYTSFEEIKKEVNIGIYFDDCIDNLNPLNPDNCIKVLINKPWNYETQFSYKAEHIADFCQNHLHKINSENLKAM